MILSMRAIGAALQDNGMFRYGVDKPACLPQPTIANGTFMVRSPRIGAANLLFSADPIAALACGGGTLFIERIWPNHSHKTSTPRIRGHSGEDNGLIAPDDS
jgi:hypothetical protein